MGDLWSAKIHIKLQLRFKILAKDPEKDRIVKLFISLIFYYITILFLVALLIYKRESGKSGDKYLWFIKNKSE